MIQLEQNNKQYMKSVYGKTIYGKTIYGSEQAPIGYDNYLMMAKHCTT